MQLSHSKTVFKSQIESCNNSDEISEHQNRPLNIRLPLRTNAQILQFPLIKSQHGIIRSAALNPVSTERFGTLDPPDARQTRISAPRIHIPSPGIERGFALIQMHLPHVLLQPFFVDIPKTTLKTTFNEVMPSLDLKT